MKLPGERVELPVNRPVNMSSLSHLPSPHGDRKPAPGSQGPGLPWPVPSRGPGTQQVPMCVARMDVKTETILTDHPGITWGADQCRRPGYNPTSILSTFLGTEFKTPAFH